ncbi:MAG: argininosuccinate lyase [Ignavibacteria bacterium]|nr:argininosuccinate lyase [Ignavibacteria bacterium]
MKLWQDQPNSQFAQEQLHIERFTIGSDKLWDTLLAGCDVRGSVAHATMLESIGIITTDELRQLLDALQDIQQNISAGKFQISEGIEDVHTQVELMLTEKLGDVGKKIHTGRSRNDQALVDIKLFIKSQIQLLTNNIDTLFQLLLDLSEEHKGHLMPGYTHMQLAMPSSFGLWFGAFAESLSDDLELLIAAYNVCNKNPLGSAAGFGSSFPIDRQQTTALLGFASINRNVVYAQMTRGKVEKITAMGLATVAATLSKMSMDVCLYLNQNFGFISFPNQLTTGSSIMPHKHNPDVFELVRAKCNRIQALPNELTLLTNNLPTGYHRDFQLTKECLFPAFTNLNDCIEMVILMLINITVTPDLLDHPKYANLFTVEEVNRLVLSGTPFRDAYNIVSTKVQNGTFQANTAVAHTHIGSIGNLCTKEIRAEFEVKRKLLTN